MRTSHTIVYITCSSLGPEDMSHGIKKEESAGAEYKASFLSHECFAIFPASSAVQLRVPIGMHVGR